ncbi:MAG: plasma-membrane proton-efflux P-type ATPase [Erysipelotrichaceae bacterium]|jgi:H+-transporting ATPase|nr:plasma-membrane proton-efflux P-type ATPase [Erysipelotrichaceae bacterium]
MKEISKSEMFKNKSLEYVIDEVGTSLNGLSDSEYERRLRVFGYNEITSKKMNPVLLFLKRFWGPMPWLLEMTIVLYLVIGKYIESVVAFSLLLINAIIGFVQSRKSKNAVEMLKNKLDLFCPVLRNGTWSIVDAKTLVPGDVIKIKLGDFVPADAYVIDGNMDLDTSSLNGESLLKNVTKSDVVYSGSIVRKGNGTAIILNTGEKTYFGKTVSLVQIAHPISKQQKIMFKIVQYMMYLGILASLILTIYAAILGKEIVSIVSLIIIFLMSAVPVALPAVMAIIQSVGASKLSRNGVLVTRLESVEDAASIDIFCFDKTGTITENKLLVQETWVNNKFLKEDLFAYGLLSSSEKEFDTIDQVIIDEAKRLGVSVSNYKQIEYVPFSPRSKKVEAIASKNGVRLKIIKGSPQTIAELCEKDENFDKVNFDNKVNEFSKKGYRSIALAISEDDMNFSMVGLFALADPLRSDTKEIIERIKANGIKPMMLTGDNLAIAIEIANSAGIGNNIYKIDDFLTASIEDKRMIVENADGFAEVYPENKYEIIKTLQELGHIVGMTGDGVNDAPALKQAELGIAVMNASDVAKASASAVLTKTGLEAILDTIFVGRETFQKIMTWIMNKITKVVEVVVLCTIGYFIFQDMIISLLGMTLLVFANDFVTISIAVDNTRPSSRPDKWNLKGLVISAIVLGFVFAIEDLIIALVATTLFGTNLVIVQTLMMFTLVINTQIRIMSIRERKFFFSSMPRLSLILISIFSIILFSFISVLGFLVPSIDLALLFITLGVSIIFLFLIDSTKYLMFRKFKI